MYWSADKQKFARENIVLRKLKNIEAIWQGIKKKEFLDDPTLRRHTNC